MYFQLNVREHRKLKNID